MTGIGLVRGVARAAAAAILMVGMSLGGAFAQKAFERDDLKQGAIRLEAQLKRDAKPAGKTLAQWRKESDDALLKNNPKAAATAYANVVALSLNDPKAWNAYAGLLADAAGKPELERERTQNIARSLQAAYIAYQRARNPADEAEALALIGRNYVNQQSWRPAMDALQLSNQLKADRTVAQLYEKIYSEHGFRIVDSTVDADTGSPRACFQFSDPLSPRADFAPFVSVEGTDKPAVTAKDQQICVDGLKHGETIKVQIRAGVPSALRGETLRKARDFTLYVRDRKPTVRFTGKNYVLPKTGQRGVPVVTVNTDSVKVAIYRIGDRSLTDTIVGSDFQRQLEPYEFESIENEKGAKVWEGTLAVERMLNTEITTAFPLDEAVTKLQPGIYVMSAQPGNGAGDPDQDTTATQWFVVSDLGLTAFSGEDGVYVYAAGFADAKPVAGVEIRLIARNNEVLATRTTDARGFVQFERGLTRGDGGLSPALVIATTGNGDYAFLNLKNTAFDLTDRGVMGRPPAGPIEAFVTTERGVYRTGETVHITALLRDAKGNAVTGVPTTLVLERPDGNDYRRIVLNDQAVGGRTASIELLPGLPTGTWRARLYTDPKRPQVGEIAFLVEDYVPDRIEFDVDAKTKLAERDKPVEVEVKGRYLFGAPAADLGLEGEIAIGLAKDGLRGYPGYQFGLTEESVEAERQGLENLPKTGPDGNVLLKLALPNLPKTARPLEAEITVKMVENGGRGVERHVTVPIKPAGALIGVKPLFDTRIGDGEVANFELIHLADTGRRTARAVRWELLRVTSRIQWTRNGSTWDSEIVKATSRVADGRVEIGADAPAKISMPATFGRYRLEVTTEEPGGPVTTVAFDAGYFGADNADSPDLLEMSLDKPAYRSGDTVTVALSPRFAGLATVAIVGPDRIIETKSAEVRDGQGRVEFKVGEDWGGGFYAVAILHRPLDVQASRMPGRAIGLAWASVDRTERTLQVKASPEATIRPHTRLVIPVDVGNLKPGETANVTVAAVDVGILNLTGFKPPAPEAWAFGQRLLGYELRDLYGQLIDGMNAVRGRIRTGSDAPPPQMGANPPKEKPLAFFSGLVTVGADGKAEVAFDVPQFNGTLRVMVVAWTASQLGHASADVVVRDPVVVLATTPRFLAIGDATNIRFDLNNVEGPAGPYTLSVEAGDGLVARQTSETVTLADKGKGAVNVPVVAANVGTATILAKLTGPNGLALEQRLVFPVNPANPAIARRTVTPLARNGTVTVAPQLLADFVPGTAALSLALGPAAALDVPGLLLALDRYPYGCSEQITSRALPLLYVSELAGETDLALDGGARKRIEDGIQRLLARQSANGTFGLWSIGGDDDWLNAYVTDFLTRARDKGFQVPEKAIQLALDHIRSQIGTIDKVENDGVTLAYGLYVLARNGRGNLGDLRYLSDQKVEDFKTPLGKAQLAAALALMGDKVRAERVFVNATNHLAEQKFEDRWLDFGSTLRDAAAILTLATDAGAIANRRAAIAERIQKARDAKTYTSTQENAWMVLAASAIQKDAANLAFEVDGQRKNGPVFRSWDDKMLNQPVRAVNLLDAPASAIVTVTGSPIKAQPAASVELKVERAFFTPDGKKADPARVARNTRLVVVLTVTDATPKAGQLMVVDRLPAGFEIENPRLVASGDTSSLPWLAAGPQPENAAFRDDRFEGAFTRSGGDQPTFTVSYMVRAIAPGRYVHPPATVEDMYRPDRFGRTATGQVEVTVPR